MAAGWFGGARATFALEESLLECCCDAVLEDVVAVDLRCTEEPGEPLTFCALDWFEGDASWEASRMALMKSLVAQC